MRLLHAASKVNPRSGGLAPERDGISFGIFGFEPSNVKDVDLAFFDPHDLSEGEEKVERALIKRMPSARWDAKNQAAVHRWYQLVFGIEVEPLTSAEEGVATWPKTATAVAVAQRGEELIGTTAFGLDDLLEVSIALTRPASLSRNTNVLLSRRTFPSTGRALGLSRQTAPKHQRHKEE